MKEKEQYMETYAAPQVEIIEVEIEKGFAVSTRVNGWGDGGTLGDYDVE